MLRTIAVALVILDHLELIQRLPGHPQGGFIGVDIFFVISGFLITGHIVTERIAKGKISLRDFYVRRARRIVPMAVLVVVVFVIASYAIFWASQANRYAVDGIWSLLFVSNIAFTASGTDYFATDAPSIFQHYWSLSVEEQFYIFWPVIVIAAGGVAMRSKHPRRTLAAVALCVFTISFIWACLSTASGPVAAYFSTFSRAFEFAAGAILAIVAPALTRVSTQARLPLALTGLIGLAASVWLIDPAVGFPGPWALLPVISTVAVIAAGTGKEGGVTIPFITSSPVIYVGNISYSLYLWHWPIIVIAAAFIPSNLAVIVIALGLTVGLSALSYRYIERAVLASSWLLEMSGNPTRRPRILKSVGALAAGLTIAVAVIGGSTAMTQRSSDSGTSYALDTPNEPNTVTRLVNALQIQVSASLSTSSWQGLTPAVDELGEGITADLEDCWTSREEPFDTCDRGDPLAKYSVALIGDSIAMTYAPGLLRLLEPLDMHLRIYAKAGCPAADVAVLSTDGSPYVQCDEFRDRTHAAITDDPPDLVVAASSLTFETGRDLNNPDRMEVLGEGWRSTLGAINGAKRVAVITAPPKGQDLAVCANRFNTPVACATTVGAAWDETRTTITRAASENGATLIDSGLWYCDTEGSCPVSVDGLIVRRDQVHLTKEYSESLAPILSAWLEKLLGS
ncbi:hypothetical protein ASF06_01790 [Agreia sp. Leaf244]|uniref:acyltransferase family protein n=1 Tax=Agreia sp. Leaf244 TaxID=1736305 RepID=UPI0006FBE535|nr:acyltransferase family protein [Agreia sp. Leaf244]KQO11412.1 hypothetical protein ASF06_01790 [Agreia sp. Leaf244]